MAYHKIIHEGKMAIVVTIVMKTVGTIVLTMWLQITLIKQNNQTVIKMPFRDYDINRKFITEENIYSVGIYNQTSVNFFLGHPVGKAKRAT